MSREMEYVQGLLLEYSEWLDTQGLIVGDGERSLSEEAIVRKEPGEDKRTHEELVAEFLKGEGGDE